MSNLRDTILTELRRKKAIAVEEERCACSAGEAEYFCGKTIAYNTAIEVVWSEFKKVGLRT